MTGNDGTTAAMRRATTRPLPTALACLPQIADRLQARPPAFFLDFDGTIAPIVRHREDARLLAGMRELLHELGAHWPVAIVSGRMLSDVRARVDVDGVAYAGEHGLALQEGDREARAPPLKTRHLEAIDKAERHLRAHVAPERLERKHCTVAVHLRGLPPADKARIEHAVAAVPSAGLRRTHGKEVIELRPDVDWHKGHAVRHLLARFHATRPALTPILLGDDRTDEEMFQAVPHGIAILVTETPRETAAAYRLQDPEEVATFLRALQRALVKR